MSASPTFTKGELALVKNMALVKLETCRKLQVSAHENGHYGWLGELETKELDLEILISKIMVADNEV
ncbi:hypothetical protein JL49_09105 [Pseudoalteromonas luteoviolacea]|nr:hypothetical protein JL49_09105 [Pseudoalteromonas luteoviolacea]